MEKLEGNSRLTEIENRLSKQPYLSKTNLPGGYDAHIFLLLLAAKKYPSRQMYPNMYHWYIVIKQFSQQTLRKWHERDYNQLKDDQQINEFMVPISKQKLPQQVQNEQYDQNIQNQEVQINLCIQQKHISLIKKRLEQLGINLYKQIIDQENGINRVILKFIKKQIQYKAIQDVINSWKQVNMVNLNRKTKFKIAKEIKQIQ